MKITPLKWKLSLNEKRQEVLHATMQGIRSKNRIGKITNMQENTLLSNR